MAKTVLQILPAFRVGGAEIMAETLIYQLKKKGDNVIAVSLFDLQTPITKRLEEKGVKIEYLGKKSGFDLNTILRLRKLVKTVKPDVIHTHLYVLEYVYLATIGLKTKIVHTVHSVAQKEVFTSRQKMRKFLFRSKRIVPVAIAPFVQDSLNELYKIEKNKIPMVFNGVDSSNCLQKNDFSLGEEIKILAVGRLEEVKNHANIIKAINSIIKNKKLNIKFQIIGDGSLKEDLVSLTKELGCENNVFLLGQKDNPYEFMQNSDIFMLTSVWEGMPITLIEAMFSKLPVIVSAVGGILDMIEDDYSGVMCEPTVESIKQAILKMISKSEKEREYLAANAELRAKEFSAENMCENYSKLYFG